MVLRRLLAADRHTMLVEQVAPAGLGAFGVVAVRDLRTWTVVREVLVRKAAIVLADRGLHVRKRVAVQKAGVRLAMELLRNVADLKAAARKVIVRNAEHRSVVVLAGNLRAATRMRNRRSLLRTRKAWKSKKSMLLLRSLWIRQTLPRKRSLRTRSHWRTE